MAKLEPLNCFCRVGGTSTGIQSLFLQVAASYLALGNTDRLTDAVDAVGEL